MDNATFLNWLKDVLREWILTLIAKWVNDPQGPNPWHRHGTVTAVVSGCAKVRFDGEDAASGKVYACNYSYTPSVGDRVYMARSGKTWLIVCRIRQPT